MHGFITMITRFNYDKSSTGKILSFIKFMIIFTHSLNIYRKLTMKKIKYSLLLACTITLVGCYDSGSFSSSSIDRMIDNPTAKEIKVTIDGKELVIPAKSKVNYTFEYGKHTLTYGDQSLNFIAKPSDFNNSGLINPTQSNYYLFTTFYTTANVSDEAYNRLIASRLNEVPVMINGELHQIELPVKVINDVFIERDQNSWDYFVDQPYPDEVTLRGKGQYQSQRIKLFREDDFITYLKSDGLEDEIKFLNQPPKFSALKRYTLPNIQLNTIVCEEGRAFLENNLNDWNKFFTSTGKDLDSIYKQLTSNKTFQTKHEIIGKCSREKDPDQSFQQATRVLELDFEPTKRVNFFITE
jgi:hypothetical protein